MLVGLQKQGKTTLLSRLREVTEVDVSSSTFTDRVMGNDNVAMSTSFRPAAALMKRFGPREGTVHVLYMYIYRTIVDIHVHCTCTCIKYMYCSNVSGSYSTCTM